MLPFFAPPVSSLLLSHLRWLALCVIAAGLHLCWSGCGFGVRPSAPSCLASHFSTFSYASLLGVLPMFVSHRSGLVAVYAEAGFLGVHMWGCVGRDLDVVPYWRSLFLCVGFFLWRRSCVSSPRAGGRVGSY